MTTQECIRATKCLFVHEQSSQGTKVRPTYVKTQVGRRSYLRAFYLHPMNRVLYLRCVPTCASKRKSQTQVRSRKIASRKQM